MRRVLWVLLARLAGVRVLLLPPHCLVVFHHPTRLGQPEYDRLVADLIHGVRLVQPTARAMILEGGLTLHGVMHRPL